MSSCSMAKKDRIPVIAPEVVWRDYGGDFLVVSGRDAKVRSLSEVAGFAFSCFDGERDLAAIARAIVGAFDVTEETAMADVLKFADDLHARGVIVWREQ